jgi:hypothetical protein
MMVANMLKRSVLTAVLVVGSVVVFGPGDALANAPWWHVNTISAPAGKSGDESRIVVEVSDLGDAPIVGVEHPVTIVDKLPAGVTPTSVYPEDAGQFYSHVATLDKELTQCTVAGQTITCTFDGLLLEYEHLSIAVDVQVTPPAGGGVNEVSLSGGQAPPLTVKHALRLNGPPAPFGVESYELTPEEEGGGPATQAGSHPFQLTTTFTFDTKAETVFRPAQQGDSVGTVLPEVQPIGLTKDLHFNLPAGLVGNPTPLPKCSMQLFQEEATFGGVEGNYLCPRDSVVGVVTAIVTSLTGGTQTPLALTRPLYNLEPNVGEPARFGFTIPGGGTLGGTVILDTSVRTGGDYGVVVTVPDVPETLSFIGSQVTFWGVPADARHDTARQECLLDVSTLFGTTCPANEKPQPFLIMPTSCTGPLQTSMEADSWERVGQFTEPTEYTFQNIEGEPYGLRRG